MDGEATARDRPAALALLAGPESKALCARRHAYAVEPPCVSVRGAHAEDEDAWGNVALLHDFDYERHPTLDLHPQDGAPHLQELGYPGGGYCAPGAVTRRPPCSVAAREEHDLEGACSSPATKLAGFVHACGLVRPEGLSTLEPRSVRKKLKQKSFAAGVNRDDVYAGAEGLGVELDEHIQVVIDALKPIHAELGLPG